MATADSIISSQQTYADEAVAQGDAIITRLNEILDEADYVIEALPEPQYVTRFTSSILTTTRPTLDVDTPTADKPVEPTITFTSPEEADVDVPSFSGAAPILNIPAVPSTVLPSAPATPVVADPDIPSVPSYTMPTAPALVDPVLPTAPTINIPEYTSELPVDDLVTPTNTFDWAEEAYSSALLDAVKAKLLSDIENGGYGIETADESAMWERMRERERQAGEAQIEEITRLQAARGFDFPPGDLLIAIQRAQAAVHEKISSAEREITIKRAELFVQNRQFSIEQSRQLEQLTMNYHAAVQERALNAQKAILDASIAVYNTLVARYNARLDAYKSHAQVFETRVRAELAKLEMYRTEMEGARVQTEVTRARVENYRAQIEAVNSIVGVYRTSMEAAQVRAQIERLRIDAFRAQVDAYAQQVQAKVAEFNMYDAQIKGQTSRMQAYETEVRAYTAQVDAAKARADIKIGMLRTEAEQATAKAGVYRAKIDAYATDLRAQIERINALVSKYTADQGAYKVDLDFINAEKELLSRLAKMEADERIANMGIAQKNAELRLMAWLKSREVKLGSADGQSKFLGSKVTAALGGLNALVSLATSS